MRYRDLIVSVDGSASTQSAIALAESVASANDGRITALLFGILPVQLALAEVPTFVPFPADFERDLLASTDRAQEDIAKRLSHLSVPHELRRIDAVLDEATRAIAHQARYADLAVFGWDPQGGAEHEVTRALFEATLLESGRPVLVTPKAAPPVIGRRALIAWDARQQASRAVHDAIPLLAAAEIVRVLVVDASETYHGHGRDPGVDIATHLSRHLANVEAKHVPTGGKTVGAVILDEARYLGADLIVMGGYGHSRLREWLLGGTTREVLEATDLPVLLSH